MNYIIRLLVIILSWFVIVSCGTSGDTSLTRSPLGPDIIPQTCTVAQTSTGAVITCPDGSSEEIANGSSVQGPTGATGPQGPQGAQGPQGIAGSSEATPKGEHGHKHPKH